MPHSRQPTPAARAIALLAFALLLAACSKSPAPAGEALAPAEEALRCPDYQAGEKNLYWGDLHVHTAYSLDAYGYGTVASPADAYHFAKGNPIDLPDGSTVKLARPLDFTAVTDHAEWFDLMYVCTHPLFEDDEYCRLMNEKNAPATGSQVFRNYVIPTITLEKPQITPICEDDPDKCLKATNNQWQRIQEQAHDANDACNFTSFAGFEWSATPSYSHNHRNVIFANEHVVDEAIDYMRYPDLDEFWRQLDQRCRPEDGCDAITIPHNNNMGDGFGFDVETENERSLEFRHRFERLVEVHQEKGNSECLSPFGAEDENDCAFEQYLTKRSRPSTPADYTEEEWEQMRRTYVRSLLLRGLEAYEHSGDHHLNPLQLGIIGSTDNHTASPGHVEEDAWHGSVFGLGDFERAMMRIDWNPGGLVAVWAEENTRESLFAAMKRREVFGTSGPRIRLQFSAAPEGNGLSCAQDDENPATTVAMGGEFSDANQAPQFRIVAEQDLVPLERIEVIKGEWRDGEARETVLDVSPEGSLDERVCLTWTDPDFDAAAPAFWYVRVEQEPTLRWSATMCREQGRCDDYPEADRHIHERAWSSPIWYLPVDP